MPAAIRVQISGGHYHVFARAVSGEALFRDDLDRASFLRTMERVVRRLRWRMVAYCLMTTHYHLILETTSADLARGMQTLNASYALRFNRRWNRYGHVFAERYASRLIDTEKYLEQACTYVLDNPVRAGLCNSPLNWPWNGGLVLEDMSKALSRGERSRRLR